MDRTPCGRSSSRFGKKFVSQARTKRCEAKSSGRKLDRYYIVHPSNFRKHQAFCGQNTLIRAEKHLKPADVGRKRWLLGERHPILANHRHSGAASRDRSLAPEGHVGSLIFCTTRSAAASNSMESARSRSPMAIMMKMPYRASQPVAAHSDHTWRIEHCKFSCATTTSIRRCVS